MSDTTTEDVEAVAPDGVTKAERVNAAKARVPDTGNPDLEEARKVGPPPTTATSALAPQEETEQNIREAREYQQAVWSEPESLADEKPEGPAPVHAADDKPGGRLVAEEGIEDELIAEEGEEESPFEASAERDAEGKAALEEEVAAREEALKKAATQNTGITGTGQAASGDAADASGPTGETPPGEPAGDDSEPEKHTRAQLRDLSKTKLRDLAREHEVEGRSTLEHDELVEAVFKAERA